MQGHAAPGARVPSISQALSQCMHPAMADAEDRVGKDYRQVCARTHTHTHSYTSMQAHTGAHKPLTLLSPVVLDSRAAATILSSGFSLVFLESKQLFKLMLPATSQPRQCLGWCDRSAHAACSESCASVPSRTGKTLGQERAGSVPRAMELCVTASFPPRLGRS